MRKIQLIGAFLVGLFVAAGVSRAADTDHQTYDHGKLTELYNEVLRDPAAATGTTPNYYIPGWYCVAAPFGNTLFGWTWWLSPNLAYSRYMALGSCTQAYGYVCQVACNWQF